MTTMKVTREDLKRLWAEKNKANIEVSKAKERASSALEAYWAAWDEYHKDDVLNSSERSKP